MPSAADTDVIHSASQLELQYEGVHPRLYANAAQLDAIRAKLDREPYADFLRRVRVFADSYLGRDVPKERANPEEVDLRNFGCGLTHLAAAYRMTREQKYLDAAQHILRGMNAYSTWTTSLMLGHWAHGAALAYDWLYDDLDPALREQTCKSLYKHAKTHFDYLTSYTSATPTAYAWNHLAVAHCGMLAAALAIWGDIENVGPIIRLGTEKARIMVDSLGPDGASAEGLAYGQYHNDFFMRSMVLCDQLMGMNLFDGCAFFQNYPMYMYYSSLPRNAWQGDKLFMHLGDANGSTWCGPDTQLRKIASRYRDGRAQWLADTISDAGNASDNGVFLNLLWHDETVKPVPPADLPTQHHLIDKDIVMGRSGWEGNEATYAFKCGPNSGHHANRRYPQDISGGHMHPDAGHFILHASGQWLIVDDGYHKKYTKHQNTIMVNGIGQVGEGYTWFEDLEIRRGHPEGRMLHASTSDKLDIAIGDAAPVYMREAKLKKYLRHVLYLKPDVWVIVDELAADEQATFEALWHLAAKPTQVDEHMWKLNNNGAGLLICALGPTEIEGRVFIDTAPGASGNHGDESYETLAISNASPAKEAINVTVLHSFKVAGKSTFEATLAKQTDGLLLTLTRDGKATTLNLKPGQSDPSTPIAKLT
jgi:hypothetical protein